MSRRAEETYSFVGQDFNSVRGETVWTMGFGRAGWQVRTTTKTVLTSTPTEFRVHAELDAYEGGRTGGGEELEHAHPARLHLTLSPDGDRGQRQ